MISKRRNRVTHFCSSTVDKYSNQLLSITIKLKSLSYPRINKNSEYKKPRITTTADNNNRGQQKPRIMKTVDNEKPRKLKIAYGPALKNN